MIILRDPKDLDRLDVYTTLAKLCKANKWAVYSTLRARKFPFDYKGYRFDKIEVNTKR